MFDPQGTRDSERSSFETDFRAGTQLAQAVQIDSNDVGDFWIATGGLLFHA
jgi:hypothetical protein